MAVIEGTTRTKTAVGEYDFAIDGGAISSITMRGVGALGASIPTGSVITGGYIDVITPLTSGGAATIAVNSEAAGDVVAATAVASWTAGTKNILPADTSGSLTASTRAKTTAARNLVVAIAAFALTAGKFRVVVEYV